MPTIADYVRQALDQLRAGNRRTPFQVSEIVQIIESISGRSLSDQERADVKNHLRVLWGHGLEPAAVGDDLWRFGPGIPPVAQEIGR